MVTAFDEQVWSHERNIVTAYDPTATKVGLYLNSPSAADEIASYTLNEEHRVVIDMSDLVRVFGNQSAVIIRSNGTGSPFISFGYLIAGFISPLGVLIPPHIPEMFVIAPPHMIYRNTSVELEVMVSAEHTSPVYMADDTLPLNTGVLLFKTIWGDFNIRDDHSILAQYNLRDQLCNHRYAVVRWESAFGTQKTLVWELIENKTSAVDNISLMSVEHDYNTIKGREDSFSLFLDNLTAYDYWYYADIIASSKVEVSIDNSPFRRVDVTTKAVSIPDGDAGKMNELKVEVKYRKYDAVAM